jgi:hypothetical protein
MEILLNEYVVIPKETLIEYYDGLINRFFKILPIFEGRDLYNKQKIYSEEVALKNYKIYITNFIIEFSGFANLIEDDLVLRLVNILIGIENITWKDHDKLKSAVFNCIDISKKLKKGVI